MPSASWKQTNKQTNPDQRIKHLRRVFWKNALEGIRLGQRRFQSMVRVCDVKGTPYRLPWKLVLYQKEEMSLSKDLAA